MSGKEVEPVVDQTDSLPKTNNKNVAELIEEAWFDVFGHTYSQCRQLAAFPGEIGEIHQGHIKFVLTFDKDE